MSSIYIPLLDPSIAAQLLKLCDTIPKEARPEINSAITPPQDIVKMGPNTVVRWHAMKIQEKLQKIDELTQQQQKFPKLTESQTQQLPLPLQVKIRDEQQQERTLLNIIQQFLSHVEQEQATGEQQEATAAAFRAKQEAAAAAQRAQQKAALREQQIQQLIKEQQRIEAEKQTIQQYLEFSQKQLQEQQFAAAFFDAFNLQMFSNRNCFPPNNYYQNTDSTPLPVSFSPAAQMPACTPTNPFPNFSSSNSTISLPTASTPAISPKPAPPYHVASSNASSAGVSTTRPSPQIQQSPTTATLSTPPILKPIPIGVLNSFKRRPRDQPGDQMAPPSPVSPSPSTLQPQQVKVVRPTPIAVPRGANKRSRPSPSQSPSPTQSPIAMPPPNPPKRASSGNAGGNVGVSFLTNAGRGSPISPLSPIGNM